MDYPAHFSEMQSLLTAEDVGQLLGMHPRTVLLKYRRGELCGIKFGTRSVRFTSADVQAYIDAHRAVAAP